MGAAADGGRCGGPDARHLYAGAFADPPVGTFGHAWAPPTGHEGGAGGLERRALLDRAVLLFKVSIKT
eukprot:1188123-Prorocentrum_minimum.AAC.1